jgi:hypothetical protein
MSGSSSTYDMTLSTTEAYNPITHIPFFFPPYGIVGHLSMTTLTLLGLTLGIHVWYISPPTFTMDPKPLDHIFLHLVEPTINPINFGTDKEVWGGKPRKNRTTPKPILISLHSMLFVIP